MSATSVVFLLSFVFCLNLANSNIFFNDYPLPSVQIDKCKTVCVKTYKSSNDESSPESECCARGCRFFGIAEMITENSNLDMSVADEACHSSCEESYVKKSERMSCIAGCDIMSKQEREILDDLLIEFIDEKPISVATSFSFSFYFEDGDGVQLAQSGVDVEPDDVLTDPALKHQLNMGLGQNLMADKLPEMKVRTLPVEEKIEIRSSECWWWLSTVVQTSHIPPCVLATLLILSVVLLAKFAFFNDGKAAAASGPTDLDLPKCALLIPEKHETFIVPSIHKQPPPKYDEVVNITEDGDVFVAGGTEKSRMEIV